MFRLSTVLFGILFLLSTKTVCSETDQIIYLNDSTLSKIYEIDKTAIVIDGVFVIASSDQKHSEIQMELGFVSIKYQNKNALKLFHSDNPFAPKSQSNADDLDLAGLDDLDLGGDEEPDFDFGLVLDSEAQLNAAIAAGEAVDEVLSIVDLFAANPGNPELTQASVDRVQELISVAVSVLDGAEKEATLSTLTGYADLMQSIVNSNVQIRDAESRITDAESRITDAESRITDAERSKRELGEFLDFLKTRFGSQDVEYLK